MWKKIIILCCVISMCLCQNNYNLSIKKKPHFHDPYYHHVIYGGGFLYYLTFIALKIKVVFVLGTIFAIMLVAGKVFALIKYAEILKTKEHHHTPEKIYIQAPSHTYDHDHVPYSAHDHVGSYSAPIKSYESSYMPPFYPSAPGFTVDKLPPNAEIAGGQYYDSPPPNAYGRSYSDKYNLHKYYKLFLKLIRKINLSEIVFSRMKLKSNECKKKFLCGFDYNAKNSLVVSTLLGFFLRDKEYDKYKTNSNITSLQDCNRLYPRCDVIILY